MNYENLMLEKKDGIATITLNRPDKLNALSPYLLYEIGRACEDVKNDDATKVVVITGAGRAFCSGADLGFPAEERAKFQETLLNRRLKTTPFTGFGEVSMGLRGIPKPVIAAVNGPATGAGFAFSLACDLRFASDTARMSAIFVRRGLMPDSGITKYLPALVGMGKALELFWTGEMIDAQEALRLGIVNKVFSQEELLPSVYEFAQRLVNGPSLSIELAKEVSYKAQNIDLYSTIALENWGQNICSASEDVQEGRKAFLEKREPTFKGR